MVTQDSYLFSRSIAENSALGKAGATTDEIVAASRAVGLHRFVEQLPDGSMDLPSEAQVQRGLATLLAGRTAIIIAHRLSAMDIAHRVLVLASGRVVADGAPDELVRMPGLFAAMHREWESVVRRTARGHRRLACCPTASED